MESDSALIGLELLQANHRQEKKDLQAKIQALKKTATKGDKKKRKEVLDEITKIESDLQKKHETELAEFKNSESEVEAVADQISDATLEAESKVSKAQKRRNKKDQSNKDREQRINEQEIENEHSLRNIETQTIKEKLQKKGLMLYEIPSDGDCLYAAIDNGLKQIGEPTIGTSNLRRLTSQYIQANPNDFTPFLCDPASGEPLNRDKLLEYCLKIENTTQWGGQLELGALAEVTKKALVIVQADGPELVMGEHFINDGQVVLAYHRHMYRLGEHYNSVQPFAADSDDF